MCRQLKDKNSTFLEAEQNYIQNCVQFKEKEGRFYAKLPWKISPSLLQGNQTIATKLHVQAKRKAHKNPDYPPIEREAFKQMLVRGTVIQLSKLPLGNGKSDGLQDHLRRNKSPHHTVNQLVFKSNSASTRYRITMARQLRLQF